MTQSNLNNLIPTLQAGEPLYEPAIGELSRLLDVLRAAGWSGYVPADDALKAMVEGTGIMGFLNQATLLLEKINIMADAQMKEDEIGPYAEEDDDDE